MAFRGWITVGRGWLRRLGPEEGLEQLPQFSALLDKASQPMEFFTDLLDDDVAGQDLAERLGRWGRVIAVDELPESAFGASRGLVLVHKCQLGLLELAEEGVPVDVFERFIRRRSREVDPQDASVLPGVFGAFDRRRVTASVFSPPPDRVM